MPRPHDRPLPRRRAAAAPAGGMRARLARMGTRTQAGNPVLEPLFRTVRANHPKADLALLERAYDAAESTHRGPDPQERRSVHHPPARGHDDPGRARHDRADPGRRAAARHGRGHAVHPRPAARASSATRSRCSSTASPSWTRSSTATPRRPRPSARWSSRWPATSGCWSSSSPTGCTTCARCATSSRRPRSARPARRSTSTRRWPTGSA